VLVNYSIIVNGVTELAIMKLDVLDDLKEIKICVAYKYKGKIYKDFPTDFEVLCKAQPVYQTVKGWQSSTRGVCSYQKLPDNAKRYIERLEKMLKVRIKYVSTGSKRDDMVVR
jgi:adenylosuccinate synthase